MNYRRLGHSGLEVSVVGIGCNNFGRRCDLNQTAAVIDQAIEEGINLLEVNHRLSVTHAECALHHATRHGDPMGAGEK